MRLNLIIVQLRPENKVIPKLQLLVLVWCIGTWHREDLCFSLVSLYLRQELLGCTIRSASLGTESEILPDYYFQSERSGDLNARLFGHDSGHDFPAQKLHLCRLTTGNSWRMMGQL